MAHPRPLVGGLFLNVGSDGFVEDIGEDRVGVDLLKARVEVEFLRSGGESRSLFDIVDGGPNGS